jgi:TPP-dependent trihydroxycyclohexane-1,2-dione (THcHDO) dehydratase
MESRLERPIMVVGGGAFGLEGRPAYHAMVGSGELPPCLAVDDFAAAIFDGPRLVGVVAAALSRAAYRVERSADGVVETAVGVRLLTT